MSGVEWLDADKGIVVWRLSEGQTMDDIMADTHTFADMLNSANRKTYTIVDFLEIKSVPGRAMSRFPEMAKTMPRSDRRSEVIALVSQRTLITMLTEVFAKVYPDFRDRFVYFSTTQEALDFVHARIRETAA
jgi:hypothetical protein